MKIKVIAFDVYGTILMHGDPENCMPPRDGFVEFARACVSEGILLVTSSDNQIIPMQIDLESSGKHSGQKTVPLEIFSGFFKMEKDMPKDFRPILKHFGIEPGELCVFGDRMDLDIEPALKLGCKAMYIPPYAREDTFDWRSVDIDVI
ncbi:MAG: HAD family hydrolase [Parachlamydiaceae bacterium]